MVAYYMLLNGVYIRLIAGNMWSAVDEIDKTCPDVSNCQIYRNNTLVAIKTEGEWEF